VCEWLGRPNKKTPSWSFEYGALLYLAGKEYTNDSYAPLDIGVTSFTLDGAHILTNEKKKTAERSKFPGAKLCRPSPTRLFPWLQRTFML
jgi:hypothetical protein